MGKPLEYLIIHCTDTPEGRIVLPEDVLLWHTGPKSQGHRGWSQVGYYKMILLDGSTHTFVEINDDQIVDPWEVTNGVLGKNSISHHIVYVGGRSKYGTAPKDTRTFAQWMTMQKEVKEYLYKHPQVKVAGHNDYADKACPSFDVRDWLELIQIPTKNIYKP